MPIPSLYIHIHKHTQINRVWKFVQCAPAVRTVHVYFVCIFVQTHSNRFGFCFGCWRWTLAYYFLLMFSPPRPPLPTTLAFTFNGQCYYWVFGFGFRIYVVHWMEWVHDVDLSGMLFIFFLAFSASKQKMITTFAFVLFFSLCTFLFGFTWLSFAAWMCIFIGTSFPPR